MKTILLFVLIPFFIDAQNYEGVKQVEGKNADELYSKAMEWFAVNFKSANDVIQLSDPVNRRIVGKGFKNVNHQIKSQVVVINMFFTLNVQFRDARYRYEISSSEIKPAVGDIVYTYEFLKEVATEDGLREYYKSMNIKKSMVSEKQFYQNLESNQSFVLAVESELDNIIKSLHEALISKIDEW